MLVLVVDDEPDVEALFRQHFRRDLRSERLRMEFAMSAADALAQVARASESSLILILSDINMPGMTGQVFGRRGEWSDRPVGRNKSFRALCESVQRTDRRIVRRH